MKYILLLLITFNLNAERFYLKNTKQTVTLEYRQPFKAEIKSTIFQIVHYDFENNRTFYKAYQVKNSVMFMWICISRYNDVILVFWSPDGDYVYRDDVFPEYKDGVVKFEDNDIKFEILIKE